MENITLGWMKSIRKCIEAKENGTGLEMVWASPPWLASVWLMELFQNSRGMELRVGHTSACEVKTREVVWSRTGYASQLYPTVTSTGDQSIYTRFISVHSLGVSVYDWLGLLLWACGGMTHQGGYPWESKPIHCIAGYEEWERGRARISVFFQELPCEQISYQGPLFSITFQ